MESRGRGWQGAARPAGPRKHMVLQTKAEPLKVLQAQGCGGRVTRSHLLVTELQRDTRGSRDTGWEEAIAVQAKGDNG